MPVQTPGTSVAWCRMVRIALLSLIGTWVVSLARLAATWHQPVPVPQRRNVRRFAA